MSKFKYLKISEFKKLRYLSINQNSNLYIVFLHGFMSDIEGEKPKNFLAAGPTPSRIALLFWKNIRHF